MRPVVRTALYAVALLMPWSLPAAVSVRLHAPADSSRLVVKQLQKETERIARPAELELLWNAPAQERTVVVELLGDCAVGGAAPRAAGAMGWAAVVDGQVQPFVTIDCDRVRATIAGELERTDSLLREVLLGRALARVLAHELYHTLSGSLEHRVAGLTQVGLRPADLVSGSFFLSKADVTPPPAPAGETVQAERVEPEAYSAEPVDGFEGTAR